MEETKPKSRKKLIILIIILAAVVAALIAGYFIYMNMGSKYSAVLYPNTYINGVNVSELTPEQAEEKVLAEYQDYELDVVFRGGEEESLEGSEFGYDYVLSEDFSKFLDNQEIFSWITQKDQEHNYDVGVTVIYDEEKLEQIINTFPELQARNMKEPTDAYMDYIDGQYKIIPSTEGNTLDPEQVVESVLLAVRNADKKLKIDGPEYYKEPAVKTDDTLLNAQTEQLNQYANADIKYILPDAFVPEGQEPVVFEITRDTLKGWLKQDDEGNYIRDEGEYDEHLATFISEMASSLKSDESTQLFDTTTDGTVEVELSEYSTFSGYKINMAAEVEQLKNDIDTHQFIERAPVYESEGNGNANHGIGDTYVEINLSRQYLWYYKNGSIVFEAPIVSGTMTTWRYTPEGIYTVAVKESPHTMKGEVNPHTGQPIYTANCTYWMNFIPSLGIGMHDYDSRGDWSSEAYLYNGSHGCINMHGYDAAELYPMVDIGTTVVAYYTGPIDLRYEGGPSTWDAPAEEPAEQPAEEPTPEPEPTEQPTEEPTPEPTEEPQPEPEPTEQPTEVPTEEPEPTEAPTEEPEPEPEPTEAPTEEPEPTDEPAPDEPADGETAE